MVHSQRTNREAVERMLTDNDAPWGGHAENTARLCQFGTLSAGELTLCLSLLLNEVSTLRNLIVKNLDF